jgi:TPP-dependent pyruvate/acetoin dehydrogenase alpha subunit
VFFCENNGYAEFSPASAQHAAPLESRASGYGLDHVAVDGNDVEATAAVMQDVVTAIRERRAEDAQEQIRAHMRTAKSMRLKMFSYL